MHPIRLLLPLVVWALAVPAAVAEGWPTKPVRAVVPVGAGSTTDIVPRAVFEQLGPHLGQNIVVENRPGAGGTIGSGFVARAAPDGYTILAHGSALTITPALYTNLNFDPARDLVPVIPLGISPLVLVVSPAKGYRTIGELVAAAKAKPGTLTFSSVGIGTATHMGAERFRLSAGVEATHVPYKGGAEAMLEVIAGRVEFFLGPLGLVLPQVRDGKLIALAVNGPRRVAALPDLPTMQEAGYADADYPIWFGLFLPAKTPREIIDRLHAETTRTLDSPKMRERLTAMGVEPLVMTPQEFDTMVKKEVAINAALVKRIGLKPE
jgi:tripartite-type tricarboxylate transporter receptor subunit TctC